VHSFQLASYRGAVDARTIIARRNNVSKDMRKLIAAMIWRTREEAKYTLHCPPHCACPFCVNPDFRANRATSK
jgi:hypothetical protein